jgi:hypothetical protein
MVIGQAQLQGEAPHNRWKLNDTEEYLSSPLALAVRLPSTAQVYGADSYSMPDVVDWISKRRAIAVWAAVTARAPTGSSAPIYSHLQCPISKSCTYCLQLKFSLARDLSLSCCNPALSTERRQMCPVTNKTHNGNNDSSLCLCSLCATVYAEQSSQGGNVIIICLCWISRLRHREVK